MMASKKTKPASSTQPSTSKVNATKPKVKAETIPKFPYTTKPSSLRRLLQEIPKKPKPAKIDLTLMKSWGFSDTNDMTILRVFKALGLVTSSNEPTDLYSQFMDIQKGPSVLADPIRKQYEPLFTASHAPDKESMEFLKNQFNIHSGGSPNVLDLQIQTFKALCENTIFNANGVAQGAIPTSGQQGQVNPLAGKGDIASAININLHIHLPENKSRRDYEQIIEDIGRYIFGRNIGAGENG